MLLSRLVQPRSQIKRIMICESWIHNDCLISDQKQCFSCNLANCWIFFDEFLLSREFFCADQRPCGTLQRAFASEVSLSSATDESRLWKNFRGFSVTCSLFMFLMLVLRRPLSFMLVFVQHKNYEKGTLREALLFMFACSKRLEIYNWIRKSVKGLRLSS